MSVLQPVEITDLHTPFDLESNALPLRQRSNGQMFSLFYINKSHRDVCASGWVYTWDWIVISSLKQRLTALRHIPVTDGAQAVTNNWFLLILKVVPINV